MQVFKELSEVSTIIAGQSPPSDTYNTDEVGLPFFQGKTDFGDLYPKIRVFCSIPQKIAEKNDILLSVRAPVGPTNLAPCKVCIGRGITAIRAGEKLNQKYLLFFFRSIEKVLSDSGTGTTFKAITQEQIRSIKIPIPTLPEQERIVALIEELFSELDKGVEALQTIKAQLKVYRQAVLKEAFESIPLKPITEFFSISGGLTKNSKREKLPLQEPYLRVANVYYNKLDLTEVFLIGVTDEENQRTKLKKGDLLFVEGNGSKDQIGRVAIWDGNIEHCLHQNHIIKARPNGKVISKYACYYFISKCGRDQILKAASSTSGLFTLSINKLKSLNLAFCDLDNQSQIVQQIESRLSVCDKIEQTVDESLAKAESLRQRILKKAFEGRL